MARFFSFFVLLVALGIAVVTRPEVAQAISGPWAEFLAEAAHRVIAMWDSNTILDGTVIRDPSTGFAVSVDTECTGIDPIVIFWAAVLAFPTNWKHKIGGLAIGLLGLQSLNFLRILGLYFTGLWDRTIFIWSHHNLWQGVIMLGAVLLFYAWLKFGDNLGLGHRGNEPGSA